MKSVIYLDELLLTNFVLAALFLTAAGLLCATVCTGVRLCTGAALAAVSAVGRWGYPAMERGPGAAGSRGSWL